MNNASTMNQFPTPTIMLSSSSSGIAPDIARLSVNYNDDDNDDDDDNDASKNDVASKTCCSSSSSSNSISNCNNTTTTRKRHRERTVHFDTKEATIMTRPLLPSSEDSTSIATTTDETRWYTAREIQRMQASIIVAVKKYDDHNHDQRGEQSQVAEKEEQHEGSQHDLDDPQEAGETTRRFLFRFSASSRKRRLIVRQQMYATCRAIRDFETATGTRQEELLAQLLHLKSSELLRLQQQDAAAAVASANTSSALTLAFVLPQISSPTINVEASSLSRMCSDENGMSASSLMMSDDGSSSSCLDANGNEEEDEEEYTYDLNCANKTTTGRSTTAIQKQRSASSSSARSVLELFSVAQK